MLAATATVHGRHRFLFVFSGSAEGGDFRSGIEPTSGLTEAATPCESSPHSEESQAT